MRNSAMHCRGLLRFPVVSLWAFVAACLVQLAHPARHNDYPCPDASAIQWVRHRGDCGRYYICHFGQPLVMPRCPRDQVWSNSAKNCVPEGSRWDDCSGQAPALTTIQRYGHSRSPYATGAPPATSARFPHTTVNPVRHTPTPVKTPSPTTPSWHAREQENKVEDKWTVIDHPKEALVKPKEKPAKTPTQEPEFKSTKTEGKHRKSPYPPPTPRTYITTRRPRTTVSPRSTTQAIVARPTNVAVTFPSSSRTTAERAHHAPTPATPHAVTTSHPATTPRRTQPTLRVTQRAHYDATTTVRTPRSTHRRDTYPHSR